MAIAIAGLGVLLYNTNTLKQVAHIKQFTPSSDSLIEEMTDMAIVEDEIYFSSNGVIVRGLIANNNWKFKELIVLPKLEGSAINCIAFNGKKEVWLGTNLGIGRFNLSTRTFELISSEMNQNRWLVDNSIRHLMIDSQNNLWISTSKILQLVNLNSNPFTHFSGNHPGSNQMNHVYSLVEKNTNEIFATGTDGLYVVNLRTGKVDLVKNSETLGTVHYITNIEADWWLVSTDEGMYAYSEKKGLLGQDDLINKFPEWKPFIRNYFNSSVKVDDKMYWASEEQEGLLIWDIATRTIAQYKANTAPSKGLPENHIHNIKQDKEGDLWLLFDNSVAKYSVTEDRVIQTIQYTPKGKTFNSGIFFDAFDDGTTIWFGTFGGGINGYHKRDKTWKYITEQDGLCNNSVYGILPETDSIIWVSTNMGISRVNYISTKCTNYYFEDGLQDNSFDEKGALQIGNRMFFGGINGFTMLDISKYKPNLITFPVYIHRVELFAKGRKKVLNDLNWETLRLPPTTSSLVIYLSALSFSNSRKLNFSYRIKGFQDDYIPVGSDNTIALNAMNSGNYDVEIRYLNEAGEFVTDDLKLSFYIVPFWYQTWWFKILLLMAALGVLYTIYLFRVTEIRNEQKIRRSIASDLHDDIGSTLTSAKMLTHLAMTESPGKNSLVMVQQNLEQATINLRDLVWVLNDKLDTIPDLVDRLKKFCFPFVQAVNVALEFAIDDKAKGIKLTKSEKRNLYLIVKEAINNSIKYSKCRNISVRFEMQKKKLVLLVEDDGTGFDPSDQYEGNGLKNIRSRAIQMNYSASIQSMEGSGTKIQLIKG